MRTLHAACLSLALSLCACGGDTKADPAAEKATPAQKVDEKADEKADEKVDEKADEKVDEKADDKADEKADEKAEPEPEPDTNAEPAPEPAPADDTSEPKTTKTTKTAAADIEGGKELFLKKCKSCHGEDGAGNPKVKDKYDIPSLKGIKESKAEIIRITKNGVKGTKMKPYAGKLSDEEMASLADFIKSL